MSRYFSKKYASLEAYTPGEQPIGQKFVKLNTNELPFPPSEKAWETARRILRPLNLYSDPTARDLHAALAELVGAAPEEVLATNGSDEILNFAFMAFCDDEHPAVFPDITYGFYPVFAELNGVPYTQIPLKEDFSVDLEALCEAEGTVFLANPNAPTGLFLPLTEVEKLVASRPERVVVVDEAYIDFGGESAAKLIHRYPNLLVCQTFSKSRSLAGGRLGFGIASKELMQDLNTIKYSTNPYNVNSMTMALGLGILGDPESTAKNCAEVMRVREYAAAELKKRGFRMPESKANFLFAASDRVDGEELYKKLKDAGILVRHFTTERIRQYNRITVGTREQMDTLLAAIDRILEEETK